VKIKKFHWLAEMLRLRSASKTFHPTAIAWNKIVKIKTPAGGANRSDFKYEYEN
jgi:hypothetical protein